MTRNDLNRTVKEFITPVHTIVRSDETIGEALQSLRSRKIDEKIIYFYVIDEEGKLKGVVSTRKLLLCDPESKIADIMNESVVRVTQQQTLEQAMECLSSHQLLAVPVVDEEEKFIGIIDVQVYLEESIDLASRQRSSDVFQLLGFTLEEGKKRPAWKVYCYRMPWIFCNMVGGIACAVISRVYEQVLGKVLLLAMFIPLILTLSESISMQSMTQSIQLLRKQRISWKRIWVRALSEWRIVILLAVTSGITVGLLSLFWGQGLAPAVTITIGLIVSITVSASVGALVPIFLHAKELDPKVASGPVVLMFADVITTTLYLSLATWWLL